MRSEKSSIRKRTFVMGHFVNCRMNTIISPQKMLIPPKSEYVDYLEETVTYPTQCRKNDKTRGVLGVEFATKDKKSIEQLAKGKLISFPCGLRGIDVHEHIYYEPSYQIAGVRGKLSKKEVEEIRFRADESYV